ncbi:hypothetical protein [Zobellia uliginosa]|nr:hypothetical protein [Zobellia uliginosa]
MKTFKHSLLQNIQGKKVLYLFLLTNTVYATMLFITIPNVMSFSNGMRLLDMQPFGYGHEYVHSLFRTLGPEGRRAYLYHQIPLDMVYPFLFGISYCLVLAYFLNKYNRLKPPLVYVCLLPLIVGVADYFENFGIVYLLNAYPETSDGMVTFTLVFTLVKSMGTLLYFLILVGLLILLVLKTLRK